MALERGQVYESPKGYRLKIRDVGYCAYRDEIWATFEYEGQTPAFSVPYIHAAPASDFPGKLKLLVDVGPDT